jgi:hypothetical protein
MARYELLLGWRTHENVGCQRARERLDERRTAPTSMDDLGDDDLTDEPSDVCRVCNDCHALAPRGSSTQALLGAQWSLQRIATARDAFRYEWRCPPCWATRRRPGNGELG